MLMALLSLVVRYGHISWSAFTKQGPGAASALQPEQPGFSVCCSSLTVVMQGVFLDVFIMHLKFHFRESYLTHDLSGCTRVCALQPVVRADFQSPGVYRCRAVTQSWRSPGRLAYPFGSVWPSLAAAPGTSFRSASIQSLSMRFQFPVPGQEMQFMSPR
ncbi:hypothetical protein EK904_009872 [Melospiza melodia maxima]|nr:hypothetical protein EK904_009872 [Melospiza melodia maxima]